MDIGYIITIFIIITTMILVLYYFGFFRYISSYTDSQKYIENYKNLDKASDKTKNKSKVVLSLTTTPEKIKKLKPVLNSLLDQTVRVDKISLNLPSNKNFEIPQQYKDMVSIFKCGKDYGSCTKCIPTLLREEDKNTIIILLDDNYVYGKDFIENMIEKYEKEECAIASKGAILITPEFFNLSVLYDKNDANSDEWIKNNITSKQIHMSYFENYPVC